MGNALEIKMDNAEVKVMIEKILNRVANPSPLLKLIQRYTAARTMKMFFGRRPDKGTVRGESWEPLKEKTLKQKAALKKRGQAIEIQRPLVRTGRMRDSIKVLKENGRGFEYGTEAKSDEGFPYPGFHNTQRPWLYWTSSDIRQMLQMAIDHVRGQIKNMQSYKDES